MKDTYVSRPLRERSPGLFSELVCIHTRSSSSSSSSAASNPVSKSMFLVSDTPSALCVIPVCCMPNVGALCQWPLCGSAVFKANAAAYAGPRPPVGCRSWNPQFGATSCESCEASRIEWEVRKTRSYPNNDIYSHRDPTLSFVESSASECPSSARRPTTARV